MANKIYVGNMNYNTTEGELRDLFSEYGEVRSVNIVMDRVTGSSKGFGFVEMESADDAATAISALNSFQFGGRQLRVNEAFERDRSRSNFRQY